MRPRITRIVLAAAALVALTLTSAAAATAGTPPVFVHKAPPVTAVAGEPYSYTFSASGDPAPTYALSTGAWSWLSINAATGTVSGTVPAGITSFSYTVTAANTAGTATAGPFAIQVTGTAGPYVTLLFSRTEMTAADDCLASSKGIAPLATVVAPYLKSLGLPATGTLQTGPTREATRFCTHYRDSLAASWADAANLATNFGWSFGSHTATYPSNIANLTPEQSYSETCGSAATIDTHGLPGGHGIIAYPGAQSAPVNLQTNYSAKCFAWGRKYTSTGITSSGPAAPRHTGSTPRDSTAGPAIPSQRRATTSLPPIPSATPCPAPSSPGSRHSSPASGSRSKRSSWSPAQARRTPTMPPSGIAPLAIQSSTGPTTTNDTVTATGARSSARSPPFHTSS